MLVHLFAVLGLGALCGGWILVQRWVERQAPGRGIRMEGCGSCSHNCDTQDR